MGHYASEMNDPVPRDYGTDKAALRHCAACGYTFVYSTKRFFLHPKDKGHLICEKCAKANDVQPSALS